MSAYVRHRSASDKNGKSPKGGLGVKRQSLNIEYAFDLGRVYDLISSIRDPTFSSPYKREYTHNLQVCKLWVYSETAGSFTATQNNLLAVLL